MKPPYLLFSAEDFLPPPCCPSACRPACNASADACGFASQTSLSILDYYVPLSHLVRCVPRKNEARAAGGEELKEEAAGEGESHGAVFPTFSDKWDWPVALMISLGRWKNGRRKRDSRLCKQHALGRRGSEWNANSLQWAS